MSYRVKYMDSTLSDMATIKEYLSQFYASTWQKVAEEIKKSAKILEALPYSFPFYNDSEEYRMIVVGNYIVLYKIIEDTNVVEIHAIWHGSMNIAELI